MKRTSAAEPTGVPADTLTTTREPCFGYRLSCFTAEQLGLPDAEVRERFWWAPEFTGNNGTPCWRAFDLGIDGGQD
jgi:hypothetical protein